MNPEELINAIGATAEIVAQFYLTLIKNGLPQQVAIALAEELVRATVKR